MITNQTNVNLGSAYLQAVQKEMKEVKDEQVQEKDIQASNTQQDRLNEIKNQIKNGTYQIDIQKTSEKMALNLLNL